MPGKNDPSLPGASYLSDWEIYRSAIESDDDTNAVAAVTQVIDLSRNANGLTNQIWLRLNRTAGAGTVSVSLYQEHNGSWAAVNPYVLVEKKDGQASADLIKWTGLLAAKYRLLLTSVTGGQKWDLHVCHT